MYVFAFLFFGIIICDGILESPGASLREGSMTVEVCVCFHIGVAGRKLVPIGREVLFEKYSDFLYFTCVRASIDFLLQYTVECTYRYSGKVYTFLILAHNNPPNPYTLPPYSKVSGQSIRNLIPMRASEFLELKLIGLG